MLINLGDDMQLHTFSNLPDHKAAHIVIDLETLSTQPNALVLSIGAVGLNKYGDILPGAGFHLPIDPAAQQKRRHVDIGTQQWWAGIKCPIARCASIDAPATTQALVENALTAFSDFVNEWSDQDTVCIWGNGCSFDNVILATLYQDWNKPLPWRFWNDRDMRTITAIFPHLKLLPFDGFKHHALDDAMHEAQQLSAAIKHLQQQPSAVTA